MIRSIHWLAGLSMAASFCVYPIAADAYQAPRKVQDEAAHYRRMAQEKISGGQLTDGVKLLRLAIKTNPVDPILRMDYVTVMSKKGEQSLKDGNRNEAIAVFKSVEEELMSAAKLFKDAGDRSNAAHALSQVAQIYRYVYRNEPTARGYFDKAVELDPGSAQIRSMAMQTS